MSRRGPGHARLEKLIENLKREIKLTTTRIVGTRYKTGAITEAKSLTAADSGTIFTIDADSGAYSITLPSATDAQGVKELLGWSAMFVITDLHATQDVKIVRADTDNDSLLGNIASETIADGAAAAGLVLSTHEILFDASGPDTLGDMVEVTCIHATPLTTQFVANGIAAT
jgi:hypothetical protein